MQENRSEALPGVLEMRLRTILNLQQAIRNLDVAILLAKICVVLWIVILALRIYILVR